LGQVSLLDVLSACRPVVAPIDPTTVRLVVPTSAGLVYRPGDVSGMAAALLRLLTTPALRHGMACRAGEVARRHPLQKRLQQSDEGNRDA
jgi:glycosyltransferase involved in cell wall biosynthesis